MFRILVLQLIAILQVGCVTTPQTDLLIEQNYLSAKKTKIQEVPFYAQLENYCGPTVLAELFSFYGKQSTPESIAPAIFVPDLKGSLQIELRAATRNAGFLAYTKRATLEELLKLVDSGFPIIVLQNLGFSWYEQWHYAVVTGYDLKNREVILHSGTEKDMRMDMGRFEYSWRLANHWMMAVLPPEKTSDSFDRFVYVKSAQELMSTGRLDSGVKALESAISQWPEYWLSYFLLGNHYINVDLNKAVYWFRKGEKNAANNATYLNNYAYTLNLTGLKRKAIEKIRKAISLEPDNRDIQDTLKQIESGTH